MSETESAIRQLAKVRRKIQKEDDGVYSKAEKIIRFGLWILGLLGAGLIWLMTLSFKVDALTKGFDSMAPKVEDMHSLYKLGINNSDIRKHP